MQARSSRRSPGITLWVLKKWQHDLPLAMRSRIGANALQLFEKSSTFCKTKPPNHQKFSESLKPTHHHHTLTTRARLFPLQIFQLQSVQHQQSKSPKELIQWHRSKSKAIHPTAITKQCHEWCHTQMGYCLTQKFFRVEQQAAGGEIHFLFRAFQLCISSTRKWVFRCHQGDSVSVSNISSFIGLFWFCKWPCSELIVPFFELLNLMSSGYREKVWLGQCSFLLWFWMIDSSQMFPINCTVAPAQPRQDLVWQRDGYKRN